MLRTLKAILNLLAVLLVLVFPHVSPVSNFFYAPILLLFVWGMLRFCKESFNLLPESDTSFFADDDGEEYAFILDGDSAVALMIQGFKGTRISKE